MRQTRRLLLTVMAAWLLGWIVFGSVSWVAADTASSPSLVVSQLKITSSNGQFITLYNATNSSLNMSNYQLEYFNNYDLTKATSSKLIDLSGTLPAHGYYMVSDDSLLLCYQLTVDSVSLDFSSTAGLVDILGLAQTSPGVSATPVLEDYVGWSKTAASGAQTLPTNVNAFLQRQPVDGQNNPAVSGPGSGSWQTVQPDPNNACGLVSATGTPLASPASLSQLLPGSEPAATIVPGDSSDDASPPAPSLPNADVGLKAPIITELLPNPAGTGNDGTDEFVELYNPNTTAFDLSGFSLQAGTTSLHTTSFPSGTTLPPQAFTAFYSADTGLSLSNSGGQVMLLDPFSNAISATNVYGAAIDGQAWALANGQWYWTTTPTPNAANVINKPVSSKKTSKTSKSKTAKATGTAKTNSAKSHSSANSTSSSGDQSDTPSSTPIHVWTLALVASLALLYGTYEYRSDLANRIHQFRGYLGDRGILGFQAARRRGD